MMPKNPGIAQKGTQNPGIAQKGTQKSRSIQKSTQNNGTSWYHPTYASYPPPPSVQPTLYSDQNFYDDLAFDVLAYTNENSNCIFL